ncbi:hypothetical protein ACFE04_000042 [Oxalis oulophora]
MGKIKAKLLGHCSVFETCTRPDYGPNQFGCFPYASSTISRISERQYTARHDVTRHSKADEFVVCEFVTSVAGQLAVNSSKTAKATMVSKVVCSYDPNPSPPS